MHEKKKQKNISQRLAQGVVPWMPGLAPTND